MREKGFRALGGLAQRLTSGLAGKRSKGRGISVAGTPELGAVVQRARELITFARHNGYSVDELVEIIEDVA